MDDSLKSILKTLLKVPIVVTIMYLIFNFIMLGIAYIKILGISLVVMFTAISNNYIPPEEVATLQNFFSTMETDILVNIDFTEETKNQARVQYGNTIKAGVVADFKFLNPLTPLEYNGGEVQGTSDFSRNNQLSNQQIEDKRNAKIGNVQLKFEYEVPGLKYYPDLD